MSPESGFPARLSEGYKAFHYGRLRHERERYEVLAERGQKPEVMIISCCDSRAAPETVFDAAPGEIFVLRNVANLVPPYAPDGEYHGTSAALEFAVQALKVRHVVVMGHGRCGGVNAFRAGLEGTGGEPLSPGDFIGKWISLLEPAASDMRCEAVGDDPEAEAARQRALEEAGIRNSLRNLMSFPYVRERVAGGQMVLHGAWFDIAKGGLWVMDPETGTFHAART